MSINILQERVDNIKTLVTDNDLNNATKIMMDLSKDFGNSRKRENEARNIRGIYNEWRDDKITYGQDEKYLQRGTKLREQILEFVDKITDVAIIPAPIAVTHTKSQASGAAIAPVVEVDLPEMEESPPPALEITDYDQAREEFKQARQTPPPPTDIIFEGQDITMSYTGDVKFTLQGIDLALKYGDITAVVGENGSGKSTLLNIVAGNYYTESDIAYPAIDPTNKKHWHEIKQYISYIPQELPQWSGKLIDNLHFTLAIQKIHGQDNIDDVDFIIARLGLEKYREAKWDQLSGGYKMRFSLAKSLLANPRLLILDEPLANLDINTQKIFLNDLHNIAKAVTNPVSILITSQHLHEIESIANHAIFLRDGQAIYNGPVVDIGKNRKENTFEISCTHSRIELLDYLESIEFFRLDHSGHNTYLLHTPTSISIQIILEFFAKNNLTITYFRDISKSTRKLFEVSE